MGQEGFGTHDFEIEIMVDFTLVLEAAGSGAGGAKPGEEDSAVFGVAGGPG